MFFEEYIMSFTKQQITAECQASGPQLAPLPSTIDGTQLLWAISGNESSFGEDVLPRHEPVFDVGGAYGDNAVMQPLLVQWGRAAACSYGPWQQMFCNAPAGYTPVTYDDLHACGVAAVEQLNKFLARWKPQGLPAIGECWNAGHPMITLSAGVGAYVHDLIGNYAVPLAA
jgi:hypothetical protein